QVGGTAIAVDATGSAYVTGFFVPAGFGDSQFPTTPGAFDTTYHGGRDAFVTKFDAAGATLIYSTFLGGSGDDVGLGIAVDANGNAYVTGFTSGGFPTTVGAFDTTVHVYGTDGFVSELDVTGAALLYSTYLGGI